MENSSLPPASYSYEVTKPQLTSAFNSRAMANSYGVFTVGQILKHSYKYM